MAPGGKEKGRRAGLWGWGIPTRHGAEDPALVGWSVRCWGCCSGRMDGRLLQPGAGARGTDTTGLPRLGQQQDTGMQWLQPPGTRQPLRQPYEPTAATTSYSHTKDVSPALLLSSLAAPSKRARGSWSLLQGIHNPPVCSSGMLPWQHWEGGKVPAEPVSCETGKEPQEQQALHHQQPPSADGRATHVFIYVKTIQLHLGNGHKGLAPSTGSSTCRSPWGQDTSPALCPPAMPPSPPSLPCSPGLCGSRQGSWEPSGGAKFGLLHQGSAEL